MYSIDTSCLNEYNFETFLEIMRIYETEKSCAVVQPTGTGKSYIMMELLKHFKDTWKIVIAPSRDFLDSLEQNKYWVSDKTITFTYSILGLNYQNILNLLLEYKINPDSVGLIIVDEMHRAGAPKWGAGLKALIALCKNAKVLGLTATPKRYDEGRDMVEELFEGRLAKNMNLGEAIHLGIIPQLSYVVGMHSINNDMDNLKLGFRQNTKFKYIDDKIEEYKRNWDFKNYFVKVLSKYIDTSVANGKHIIFASGIEEAENIARIVKPWFIKLFNTHNINVYCIHSKRTDKSESIQSFFSDNKDGEVKVAVAVNMLNESFHCNDIKTISMFRGTQSINVYMQQIGRALSVGGNTPFIFDFVDNYHSIDELHDILSIDNIIDLEDACNSRAFIFKDFYDETVDFVKDLSKLKKLIDLDPDTIVNEALDKIKETDDNILLSIKDQDFVDWIIYAINNVNVTQARFGSDKELSEKYNSILLSIDIIKSLGKEWYNIYKEYINNKDSLDQQQLKILRSVYNKAVLLNSLSNETIEFFKNQGIASNLIYNEDKLLNLLNKNKPKTFRLRDKLLELPDDIENNRRFTIYKTFKRVDEAFNDKTIKSWNNECIGDAAAYWLWLIYKDKYNSIFNEVNSKFDGWELFDKFIYSSKKSIKNMNIGEVNEIDKLIDGKYSIDELSDDLKSILEHHKIKSIDRIVKYICDQIYLSVDESNIVYKLNEQLKTGKITANLKDYARDIKKSAYEHLDIDHFKWSQHIMNKYNKILNLCDAIICYNETDKEGDYTWFNEYVEQIKNDIINNRIRIGTAGNKVVADTKLNNTYNKYNTIQSIEDEIASDRIDEFRIQFKETYKKWNKRFGNADDNTLNIAIISITRSSVCKDNIGVNNISHKLQKAINEVFNGLLEAEKLNIISEINKDKVNYLYKTFEIIGEDIIYLLASIMSKRSRELYISMYKNYCVTGKVFSKSSLIFFEDATDIDSQIMNNIHNSELLKSFDNFRNFNVNLYNTYCNIRS